MRRYLFVVIALFFSITITHATTPIDKGSWFSATPLFWEMGAKLVDQYGLKPLEHKPDRGTKIGEKEQFYTINVAKNAAELTTAVLKRVGKSCYIYLEEGAELSEATIDRLLNKFENEIYPTNHRFFGSEWNPGIDWDPRVTLLFLDIKDGWAPGKGYVGGYFYPIDEFSKRIMPTSNEREIIYLDTFPSDPNNEGYLGILAHEFQHMIHFNNDPRETVWLNEALAQIAFYVNKYGHAPQVVSFIRQNAFSLEKFKENGVQAYGYAYLWIYYLMTKYFGETEQEWATAIKAVVSSKKQGLESIVDVLHDKGVDKPIERIYFEFVKANLLNDPKTNEFLGYDETLAVRVQPQFTFSLAGNPVIKGKGKMSKLSTAYFSFLNEVAYLPVNPTMLDKVAIYAKKNQDVIHWNINEGIIPPKSMIPEGSTILGGNGKTGYVATPVSDIDGGKGIVLGPFHRKGIEVSRLNVSYSIDGESAPGLVIPIFSMPQLASVPADLAGDQKRVMTLEFSANGAKLQSLFAVIETVDGNRQLVDVPFKKDKATFTYTIGDQLRGIHFGYSAFDGKKVSYAYRTKFAKREAGTKDASASVIDNSATIDSSAAVNQESDRTAKTKEMEKAAELEKKELANKKTDNEKFVDELVIYTKDDEDKSHDNMGYRISKKAELVHGLTHLQISPQWEQLLKIWKLLEMLKGFPHLPLPDGWAIKDFNEAQTLSLLKRWADLFKIDYPFNKEFGPIDLDFPKPKAGNEELVKETLRRMTVCEAVMEFAYTNGLTLAADSMLSVYEFARFIVGVRIAINTIYGQFSKVPVVGPIVKKVTDLLQSKLLNVVQNFSYFIANRLAPPANLWVPIIVSYAINIYARTMNIEYIADPYPGFDNKEIVIGLFGKYLISSVPKVGTVDRAQRALNAHADLATGLDFSGTYAQVVKKVLDDGDPTDFRSVRERITKEIVNRHRLNLDERRIARIGAYLTQVFQYASVIDPSNVTKILTIATGLATSGVLMHSTYISLGYLIQLSGSGMSEAVNATFHPDKRIDVQENHVFPMEKPNIGAFNAAYNGLKKEFDEYLRLLGSVRVANEGELRDWSEKFQQSDENIDRLMSVSEAIGYSVDPEDRDLVLASQDLYSKRAMAMAETTNGLISEGIEGLSLVSSKIDPLRDSMDNYLDRLNNSMTTMTKVGDRNSAKRVLHLDKIRFDRKWTGNQEISVTLTNLSRTTITGIRADLQSGLTYRLGSAKVVGVSELTARESVTLKWKIKLSDYDLAAIDDQARTVTVIVNADDHPGVARIGAVNE